MYLRHDVDPTIYVTGVPVHPDNCFVNRDISMAQFHKSVTSWYPDQPLDLVGFEYYRCTPGYAMKLTPLTPLTV